MENDIMEKDVFEMTAEYFINERLEDILMRDEEAGNIRYGYAAETGGGKACFITY